MAETSQPLTPASPHEEEVAAPATPRPMDVEIRHDLPSPPEHVAAAQASQEQPPPASQDNAPSPVTATQLTSMYKNIDQAGEAEWEAMKQRVQDCRIQRIHARAAK